VLIDAPLAKLVYLGQIVKGVICDYRANYTPHTLHHDTILAIELILSTFCTALVSVQEVNLSDMADNTIQELHNPDYPLPDELKNNIAVTTLDKLYNWSRAKSVWPMLFGLACCAIEMIATAAARYDPSRFGMEVMRPSPRQCDLMIVSGTVTKKMVPQIVRLYNQMAEPRYVLAMGACASGGGPFKEGYNVVDGIDKFLPVDVYVPGCPPTPQALLYGFMAIHEKIEHQSLSTVPWYRKGTSEPIPIPILGPDLMDPRQMGLIEAMADSAAAQHTMDAVVSTEAAASEGSAA
jgi:NADH-quinone oxidoreductase subunit B